MLYNYDPPDHPGNRGSKVLNFMNLESLIIAFLICSQVRFNFVNFFLQTSGIEHVKKSIKIPDKYLGFHCITVPIILKCFSNWFTEYLYRRWKSNKHQTLYNECISAICLHAYLPYTFECIHIYIHVFAWLHVYLPELPS